MTGILAGPSFVPLGYDPGLLFDDEQPLPLLGELEWEAAMTQLPHHEEVLLWSLDSPPDTDSSRSDAAKSTGKHTHSTLR